MAKNVQFEVVDESGKEWFVIYRVPEDTVISEWDAEADAEAASMAAKTYPPLWIAVGE